MLFRRRRATRGVRFRLTLAGWLFLGASSLVAVTALNSGLALLFVMFGCMLGALHVSAVLSRRMIAAVTVRRDAPPRCRQNQRVGLGYLLRAVRGGGSGLALEVDEVGLKEVDLPPAYCGYLSARQEHLSRTEMIPHRRGRIHLTSLRLATTFPFGLVRATRHFEQGASVVVWPARGRLRAGLIGRGASETASAAPSIRAGGQDEFYGLREYRLGDNARWIHWRRSAGRAEPVIREMARPRPRTLWVVLDTHLADGSPAARAARETAIRLTATLMEDALAAGYRVGAAFAYARDVVVIPPGERRAQRHHLLDALTDVDDNRKNTLGEAIARLRPAWLHQAHAVVVSASTDVEAEAAEPLVRLRRDCRELTVLDGRRLAEVFQDDPVAAGQEGA
jgi:uncharacterized protein (DUF58 family)